MSHFSTRILLSLCLGLTCVGVVQAAPATLESKLLKCRQVQDLSARLVCFDILADGLVDSRSPKHASAQQPNPVAAVAEPQPPVAATAAVSVPTAGTVVKNADKDIDLESLFGKTSEQVNQKLEIDELQQIRSRVVRTEQTPAREYIVYLENGQVWRQKSNRGAWRIKEGATAVISSAFLGSFKMRVEGKNQSVRATRID
jgi:hypothetical protein